MPIDPRFVINLRDRCGENDQVPNQKLGLIQHAPYTGIEPVITDRRPTRLAYSFVKRQMCYQDPISCPQDFNLANRLLTC
jgi:hypothetical protein